MRSQRRVLALEVVSTSFAFAVLEGPERLVEWGSRDVSSDTSRFISKLEREAERYRPDVLVIEDPGLSRKGERTRSHLAWAEEWGSEHGLNVAAISTEAFREYCLALAPTKQERAEHLSELFAELEPFVPAPRKVWEAESKRLTTFVAVLRGLYWYDELMQEAR